MLTFESSSALSRGDGFTLLEVLVAVALLALSVTVVLQLFSADLRAISASEDYVSAAAKANAKMREALDEEDLPEKSTSEMSDDGYRVDVSVSEAMKERTENLRVRLLEIVVTVSWEKGTKSRSITMRTMKTTGKKV